MVVSEISLSDVYRLSNEVRSVSCSFSGHQSSDFEASVAINVWVASDLYEDFEPGIQFLTTLSWVPSLVLSGFHFFSRSKLFLVLFCFVIVNLYKHSFGDCFRFQWEFGIKIFHLMLSMNLGKERFRSGSWMYFFRV